MKNNKIIVTLATVFTAVMCAAGSVKAAPVQMADGNVFDAEFYAAAYPDVVAVFGTDPNTLYMHYVNCGAAEGRLPYANATTVTPAGTSVDYIEKQVQEFSALIFPSDDMAFGHAKIVTKDGRKCIQIPCMWYQPYSFNSYMDESYFFDANAYAMYNPDVVATYGSSKEALWNHYKTIGVYEGRTVAATNLSVNAELKIIQVAQSITTPQMTNEEKIRAVHDWMCNYANYDQSTSFASHTLPGFIYNHVAYCDGYAYTFEYFMYVLDIPCEIVTGGNHAWNRVNLGGCWYYIDVCWDDPICTNGGDAVRYDYYMLTEDQMNRDHIMAEIDDYF